jgi:hypothetical protein
MGSKIYDKYGDVSCQLAAQIYKKPAIISGTGAGIWSKLTLGLLATITLEVTFFRTYAPFPALLPFFKCILEVVFCGDV